MELSQTGLGIVLWRSTSTFFNLILKISAAAPAERKGGKIACGSKLGTRSVTEKNRSWGSRKSLASCVVEVCKILCACGFGPVLHVRRGHVAKQVKVSVMGQLCKCQLR